VSRIEIGKLAEMRIADEAMVYPRCSRGEGQLTLQIILADNQAIFRTGVARVLAMQDDMQLAAQCADEERLKEAVGSLRRSIVIFPSSIAGELGTLLDWIEQAGSRAVVIVEHGATLEEGVARRMNGIVTRSVAGTQLVECLHRVARGERCVQRAMVKSMPAPDRIGAKVLERLTPKELQIVALIAEGCKNKEIATQLDTKEQVVKNYLRNIYDKVGVSDRLELALFTIHHRALGEAAERARTALVKTA
jgi:DNA-binding NarL/FixJ family response regulator